MTQQAWFLRHGQAEPHAARADPDRRLTEQGMRQSAAAGRALVALGARFDAVYTSPRVRARDTALLACQALGGEPIVHQPLSAGFNAHDLLELAAGLSVKGSLLLVGHEPDFSNTIAELGGGRVKLRKGGIAAIALRPAQLLALWGPGEIARLAAPQSDRELLESLQPGEGRHAGEGAATLNH